MGVRMRMGVRVGMRVGMGMRMGVRMGKPAVAERRRTFGATTLET